MTIINKITLLLFIVLCSSSGYAQNNYNLKKEYGFNGNVKKVTSYMVKVGRYEIPTDTLGYYGKNVMLFTKKGDLKAYKSFFDMPNYYFFANALYSGTGKNITFTEKSKLNSNDFKQTDYRFIWKEGLVYTIESFDNEEVRTITLNDDFTVNTVHFKLENYESEEKAFYTYKNGVLSKVVYKLTVKDNDEISVSEDVRIVQSADIFNNPTVIYFYKTENSRVPSAVLFRYYEYYND